jgi:hypothetical protein
VRISLKTIGKILNKVTGDDVVQEKSDACKETATGKGNRENG